MTEAGWIVSGKRRQINARCGGLPEKSAEFPPFHPKPLERDVAAGLAGKVCLWPAAPGKRRRNKKIRTRGVGRWGRMQLLL